MALKHSNCCEKIKTLFYVEEQMIIVLSGEKQGRDGNALCWLTLAQSMDLSELQFPHL